MVVAAAAVGLILGAACTDKDDRQQPRSSTTTTTSARSEAAGDVVEVLGRWPRSAPPAGAPAGELGPLVTVTDDLDSVWSAWGPDGADRPAPPDTEGSRVAVVWDGGGGLTVSGVDVTDRALVIIGVRVVPGAGCPAVGGGAATTVVSLSGIAADVDIGVGLPRIVETSGPPC